jgi:hypothetical protein
MHITPALAEQWLERNTRNRPMNARHVDHLLADILDGFWQVNGEAIKFDTQGNLIDGQHRLAAIMKAGRAIDTMVMWNVPDSAFETIDSGRKRQAADVLSISGVKNAALVAAAAKLLWKYANKKVYSPEWPTSREVAILVDGTPELVDAAADASGRKHMRSLMPSSITAWLMYETRRRDPIAAETFWERLDSGEHLASDSPVHRLRERLQDNRASKTKLYPTDVAALAVIAWNNHWKGRSTRQLKHVTSPDVPASERFPVIGPRLSGEAK